MNYRHAYHVGNHGDVLKHVVLLHLLEALRAKPAPFHLLDSHAGIGLYDLAADATQRGGEYRLGIGAVLADPQAATALPLYWAALKQLNPALELGGAGLRHYPGSPWLMQQALREADRLALVELHPEDNETLRINIGGDARIGIHRRDAYEALRGLLPPTPRRGLALIDPAYEQRDEFERIGRALLAAHRRWPVGQIALWYPIKDAGSVDAWAKALARDGLPPSLRVELLIRAATAPDRLNGSGLLLLNPPWRLDQQLKGPLAYLLTRLGREPGAATRLEWLVRPKD
ncbi:23S rRNA (adenine(2030)-N(6))-methyltransferase RlmJ [Ferrovibrio sp.]|uniref:23S rRNA (adenine(2030)-N(6))-methyltransferase RlmJ n=1 Tax=Ferrovibrio sp. TaxID=1917215 RepID=UPI001B3E443B|nr:23S rRNA (adenine(2030)-N(6))-methyltransferase RlmJ [Ferrovibrio sp.]MBP7064647.1 23S rRNA (adenine(2030)-N(6))-methyltransferase RlmJ [Ferrovibrio sp.]